MSAGYASVCLTASQHFGWDREGERKRAADRELSFSNTLAVYIDGAGSGEAVASGRSASGLAYNT